MHHSVTVAAFP